MPVIQFRDATKRYRDGTVAVDSLNLDIEEGKTTVLVGPSGCGKTTTLRMINRMVEPTSGQITINGENIQELPKAELRRSIGYVIQNAGLFPHRTVLQNIMTVPRLNGASRAEAAAKAREMMAVVGLPADLAARYPAQLSGGQAQRVGVARALAGEPGIILMDEPFSALDPVVRNELQSEFKRLVKEFGTTVVFVTHDIDEAIKVGDEIAVFEAGGKVAQFATPKDLLRRPATAHVAEFVGKDRGFRALSFDEFLLPDDAALLPCNPSGTEASPDLGGWTVKTTEDGEFAGWVRPGEAEVTSTAGAVNAGASVREALDAVLSSPCAHAVLLDEEKKPRGLFTLDHLIANGLTSPNGAETT